jgi:hypothetical protein
MFEQKVTLNINDELTRKWVSGQSVLDPDTNEFVSREERNRRTVQRIKDERAAAWEAAKRDNPELTGDIPANGIYTVPPSEERSIVGMVSVPVATDFTESKQSLNELTTQRGDLATVPDIDLCGFMSNLPESDISLPSLPDLQSTLDEVMASVQGITLPVLQVASDAIYGIVGTVDSAVGDLGAALQSSIPTLSCGKKAVDVEDVEGAVSLGQALVPESQPPSEAVVETPAYGTQPIIVIDSPEVTVDALDDQIDLGEF